MTPDMHDTTRPFRLPSRYASKTFGLAAAGLCLLATNTALAAIVTDDTVDEVEPAIAYNPDTDQFLVVWQSNDTFGGQNILGQRFEGDGTLYGSPFVVAADLAANDGSPSVAYNPAAHGFVVAYVHDDGVNANIRIRQVPTLGATVLQPFENTITTDARDETAPEIAFNAAAGVFVVTYELAYSATDHDVRAVRVDANTGLVTGSPLSIQASSRHERTPDIECSTAASGCALAFEFEGSQRSEILIRTLDASAWTLDPAVFTADNGSPKDESHPRIAADDSGGYLVAWQHAYSSTDDDVHARRLASDGSPQATVIPVATQTYDERLPDLAYADGFDEFYIAWETDGPNGASDGEIWQRPVTGQSQLRAPRRLAFTPGIDERAPAIALSGDFPNVGMAVWAHVLPAQSILWPSNTDVHIGAVLQSGA